MPLSDRDKGGDDLDQLIDEVFGKTTDERPGRFDIALIAIGALLAGWAWFSGGSTFWIAVGIGAVLLGLALPLRSLTRSLRGRRLQARQDRALRRGYPLDVSHPATAALVESYGSLLRLAAGSDAGLGSRVASAGHLALVEVATLLEGQPPVATAQVRYVQRRIRAIDELTTGLEPDPAGAYLSPGVGPESVARAEAVARAREELDAQDEQGSLDQLASLSEELHVARRDGSG